VTLWKVLLWTIMGHGCCWLPGMAIMLVSGWVGFSMVLCLALLSAAARRLPQNQQPARCERPTRFPEELDFALAPVRGASVADSVAAHASWPTV